MPYVKRKHLEDLILAGSMLSNIAFNLAQAKGKAIEARHAQSMDETRREWDAALVALRTAGKEQ